MQSSKIHQHRGFNWGRDFSYMLTWPIEKLIMQWNISLFCSVVRLFLLCFAEVCPSVAKHPKHWLDIHHQTHQNTHRTKTFCDPSFGNQTAGAITQVMPVFDGSCVASDSFCMFIFHFLSICPRHYFILVSFWSFYLIFYRTSLSDISEILRMTQNKCWKLIKIT